MVGEGVLTKGPEGSFRYLPFPMDAIINEEPSNVGEMVYVYQNLIKACGKV